MRVQQPDTPLCSSGTWEKGTRCTASRLKTRPRRESKAEWVLLPVGGAQAAMAYCLPVQSCWPAMCPCIKQLDGLFFKTKPTTWERAGQLAQPHLTSPGTAAFFQDFFFPDPKPASVSILEVIGRMKWETVKALVHGKVRQRGVGWGGGVSSPLPQVQLTCLKEERGRSSRTTDRPTPELELGAGLNRLTLFVPPSLAGLASIHCTKLESEEAT